MSKNLPEVVRLRKGKSLLYLLWESCESEPDRYIAIPETSQLVTARTLAHLLQISRQLGFQFRARPRITEYDLRESGNIIAQLMESQKISCHECGVILDAWNLLGDICRSVGVRQTADNSMPAIEEIYTKIFAGNNLPSVTPPGKSYSPTLNLKELGILRGVFRKKQIAISEKCPALVLLRDIDN